MLEKKGLYMDLNIKYILEPIKNQLDFFSLECYVVAKLVVDDFVCVEKKNAILS